MSLKKRLSDPELSGQLFSKLFANSVEALFLLDAELNFVSANNGLVERFGADIQGQGLKSIFWSETAFETIHDRLNSQGRIENLRCILRSIETEKLFADLSLIPLNDEHDTLIAYQGILHDVTDMVLAQSRIARAEKIALTRKMMSPEHSYRYDRYRTYAFIVLFYDLHLHQPSPLLIP